MPMLPTLEGERVRLRQLKRSDAESLRANANDRKVSRYLFLPYPYRLEDALSYIAFTQRMARRKQTYLYGIELLETGQVIGCIGLHHIERAHRHCEVGYWLSRKHWREGYGSEALRLILTFAFTKLKMIRVQARTSTANKPSYSMLERNGFTREGCFRHVQFLKGRWHDYFWYGILKKEFKGAEFRSAKDR